MKKPMKKMTKGKMPPFAKKSDGPAKGKTMGGGLSGDEYSQGDFGKGKVSDRGRKK